MDKSRIPNFYKMPISERLDAVYERGLISEKDYKLLKNQQQKLDINSADKMIENVIGVMGCLLYTSPSPRDRTRSRMPSSA